jgi:signal transduction histidine kinase
VLVLALAPAYIPAAGRTDTWTMWAYPVTLSTVLLLATGITRRPCLWASSGALALAYLAVAATPSASTAADRVTAVVNALAYPGFTLVAYFVARFIRNLASAADTARQRVAELEHERSRAVVHDLLAYLRLDRFAAASDQERSRMIAQAQAKHEQMRSYVDGGGPTRNLGECIAGALRLHPSLEIRCATEAVTGLRLAEDVLEQLGQALDTALSNVEQHAPGAAVALSVIPGPGCVTVTIQDNGPGFDPAATPARFGIREVLGRQLEHAGGSGEVHSERGAGTRVRLTVPAQRT